MSPRPAPAAPAADPSAAARPLLRQPAYLWWLASDTSSAFGLALQSFAVPLLALYLTDSPAQAGLIAAIGQVGRVLAIVPGGVLADRHDRRRLMVVGGILGALLAGAVAGFHAAGLLGFWLLTALNLLINMRQGLLGAAGNAALKNVVDEARLGSALAANQGRDAAIALSGGPAGGLLMALGQAFPFAASALAHLTSALAALCIRADLRPRTDDAGAGPGRDPAAALPGTGVVRAYLHEARQGFVWLLRRGDLRGVAIVSTVINLGFNAGITTIVFGLQQGGRSPATIGWVSAAIGVGMLTGAVAAPALVRRFRTGRLAAAGLVLASLSIAATPFAVTLPEPASVPVLLGVLAAGTFGIPAVNAGLLGYFMAAVPSSLMGRASSALDLMAMGAIPFAPLIAGFGYAALGWSGALLVSAGICAAAALMALGNRGLRSLPGPARWGEHAAAMSAGSAPAGSAPAGRP
ncbi:MFS transporter [Arthrobacter halodurans]|uniref:MFS transporter n=1 Tax=Arthrobacter halodurans TaxID=516699 RepID=A0ABV4UNF6_9MICC